MYIICVIKLLPLRLRQAGGLSSQVPSFWQVRTGAPTNSYPSLQAKVAVSPSELPDCDTTPFAGLMASGHRAVQNGDSTNAIVVKAVGDLKLTHVYTE